jgi:hypothetical protein
MALHQVKSILLRIATDGAYRHRFLTERQSALEKYQSDLSQEELDSLLALSYDEQMLAEKVAEPVSRITVVGDIRS